MPEVQAYWGKLPKVKDDHTHPSRDPGKQQWLGPDFLSEAISQSKGVTPPVRV